MSDYFELERCALCGGVAWMQREHGEEFDGPNGKQKGTARYIRCQGGSGPLNPETGEEEDQDGDWDSWVECEPDECVTYDEQHGGQYHAGEIPCAQKWNAMQRAIKESMSLLSSTPEGKPNQKATRL